MRSWIARAVLAHVIVAYGVAAFILIDQLLDWHGFPPYWRIQEALKLAFAPIVVPYGMVAWIIKSINERSPVGALLLPFVYLGVVALAFQLVTCSTRRKTKLVGFPIYPLEKKDSTKSN